MHNLEDKFYMFNMKAQIKLKDALYGLELTFSLLQAIKMVSAW